jgi:glycosyltransferase involved in cell wall biosynthesis
VACILGGEDAFLDGLSIAVREKAWATLAERCRDVDLFLPPTRYFADVMSRRLGLSPEQVQVVPNGINLAGYEAAVPQNPPVLGYFARMCREKGLDVLVDAYLLLKQRDSGKNLRLHVGGGCGPMDEPFVEQQRVKLRAAGMLDHVRFYPNVDHAGKLAFYRGLTVFSAPALFGEAFGLYLIEALAAGVPVAQPRHASFPELIEATDGGVLCEPGNPKALADAIESLLLDPERAQRFGAAGRKVVAHEFDINAVAAKTTKAFERLVCRA